MADRYQQLYLNDEGTTLRPGAPQEAVFEFQAEQPDSRSLRLMVCGETALHYLWKNEPDYPVRYRQIEDALCSANADQAQFCLRLGTEQPQPYIKRLYKKLRWPPRLSYLDMVEPGEEWRFGLKARAAGLRIAPGGYLRMVVEIRLLKEGVHPHSVALPPDHVHILPIPEGNYGWRTLAQPIRIPHNTANVGVLIEGLMYEGEVFVELPFLSARGFNLLPDFTSSVANKPAFDWTAQNLSEKEWPRFALTLNGQPFLEKAVFERCHRRSEWTVPLPRQLIKAGTNRLGLRLVTACHDPLPYTIFEIGVIERPDQGLDLISLPPCAVVGQAIPLLIRTDGPMTLRLSGPPFLHLLDNGQVDGPGLSVLQLICDEPANELGFVLTDGEREIHASLSRVLYRVDDGLCTGTGDLIYLPQDEEETEAYLSWYMEQQIGNLLTIRPAYRWCGARVADKNLWKKLTPLMNALGLQYAHMLDGRELPGLDANPPASWLKGKGFLGRQTHERDGAQFYWKLRHAEGSLEAEQFYDMEQRIYHEQPDRCNPVVMPHNYFYTDRNVELYRHPDLPRDMRQIHQWQVAQLRRGRGNATRHTGPSVMFKYLLEAGYQWVGAETMYGSMEPLMAFLRGAAKAAGCPATGVHHAVQWSSSPHDNEYKYRRFRLALYVSYMQGTDEINTEEGLWHIEEYYSHFHRFSEACRSYTKQQQDFHRFLASHERSGLFHAPMALLHGRYDGWHAFGPDQPWGWYDVKDCDAEKSWDLLKVFYPLSKPGAALYLHGCPEEPVGYHSGTPRGNIDVLPVEAEPKHLRSYAAMAFLGYNCAEAADLDKLLNYAQQGGKLLLGWAHLSTTTARPAVEAYDHGYLDHELTNWAGGTPAFTADTVGGHAVHINHHLPKQSRTLAATDSGAPLLLDIPVGKGHLLLLNAREYPAHPGVRSCYEEALRALSDEALACEPARLLCGNDVQYTAYLQPDGSRHLYVLAVDWYHKPESLRHATLKLQEHEHPVSLPFGVMLKIVCRGEVAAWTDSEDADIMAINEKDLTVQGSGQACIRLVQGSVLRTIPLDFRHNPVQTIALS